MSIIHEKFVSILRGMSRAPVNKKMLQQRLINGFRFRKEDMNKVFKQLEREKYLIRDGRKYKIRL
jgi:hypothetical protein